MICSPFGIVPVAFAVERWSLVLRWLIVILATFLAILQKNVFCLVSSLSLTVLFETFFVIFFGQFLWTLSIFSCLFQIVPTKESRPWTFCLTLAAVVPSFGPQRARRSGWTIFLKLCFLFLVNSSEIWLKRVLCSGTILLSSHGPRIYHPVSIYLLKVS